jgi:hypothetical protein
LVSHETNSNSYQQKVPFANTIFALYNTNKNNKNPPFYFSNISYFCYYRGQPEAQNLTPASINNYNTITNLNIQYKTSEEDVVMCVM